MLPDVPIVLCHSCNHFFHEEDWEFAIMTKGCCPFCRLKTKGDDTGSLLTPAAEGGEEGEWRANVLSINWTVEEHTEERSEAERGTKRSETWAGNEGTVGVGGVALSVCVCPCPERVRGVKKVFVCAKCVAVCAIRE